MCNSVPLSKPASALRIAAHSVALVTATFCALLASAASPEGPERKDAPISFTDVSRDYGILSAGPTAGSAWGDANGDGSPDLWVSNHHGRPPHLFVSQQDANGTLTRYVDAASSLDVFDQFGADNWPDFHGASWADYDNDGDQDIIVLTGAGAGRGTSANYLFRSEPTGLRNVAVSLGLDYPMGRGRTPLWLDANADGRLDLLVMNKPRKNAPSQLFLQDSADQFTPSPQALANPSWWDSMVTWVTDALGLQTEQLTAAIEFAQLLPASDRPLWIQWGKESTVQGFTDAGTTAVQAPTHPGIRGIQDAAIADFNNDGQFDWFLLRALPFMRDVELLGERAMSAVLNGDNQKPAGLSVQSSGSLTVSAHRPWMDPSDPRATEPMRFLVGNDLRTSMQITQTFAPEDASADTQPEAIDALSIRYDANTATWHLMNTSGPLNVELSTSHPINSWAPQGFKPGKGAAASAVLLAAPTQSDTPTLPKAFVAEHLPKQACQSVAAADFDNDTDIDLFLTCTHPVSDAPDLLLENDGSGSFRTHTFPAVTHGRANQVSVADFDADGFVDLLVTNGGGAPPFADDGPVQLLRNTGNSNSWLEIDLVGTTSNKDAIGAIATVTVAGQRLQRLQDGGMHSFSQDYQRLHFGLGAVSQVDKLEIRWPSGKTTVLRDLQANQILTVSEATSS